MIGKSFIQSLKIFVGGRMFFFGKAIFLCLFCALRKKVFYTTNLDVSAISSNLHLTCPEERLGRKLSVKKTSLKLCSDFQQNVPDFKQFFSTCTSQSSLLILDQLLQSKIVWKKKNLIIFSKFWAEEFRISVNLLRQCSQNCILRTQRKILEEFLFNKSKFVLLFGLWAETIRTLSENF